MSTDEEGASGGERPSPYDPQALEKRLEKARAAREKVLREREAAAAAPAPLAALTRRLRAPDDVGRWRAIAFVSMGIAVLCIGISIGVTIGALGRTPPAVVSQADAADLAADPDARMPASPAAPRPRLASAQPDVVPPPETDASAPEAWADVPVLVAPVTGPATPREQGTAGIEGTLAPSGAAVPSFDVAAIAMPGPAPDAPGGAAGDAQLAYGTAAGATPASAASAVPQDGPDPVAAARAMPYGAPGDGSDVAVTRTAAGDGLTLVSPDEGAALRPPSRTDLERMAVAIAEAKADAAAGRAVPDVAPATPFDQVASSQDAAPSDGPPVEIVIHAPPSVGAEARGTVMDVLREAGYRPDAPATVNLSIRETQLRYFHASDRPAAEAAAALLGARLRDFTDYRPSPKAGLVEVWISGEGPRTRSRTHRSTRARSSAQGAGTQRDPMRGLMRQLGRILRGEAGRSR